jgi:N-dimethylarginine dimethylaminohydrolase
MNTLAPVATAATRAFGVRSMTAPLRRALLSAPATGDFASAGWRERPDPTRLRAEHESFAELLTVLGVDVTVLPPEDGLVDACYAYDPVFVTGSGSIALRMAKAARAREPERLVAALERLDVPTIGRLDGDAVADGGDMCWLDDATLAVARGYRTNDEAHRRLSGLLALEGVAVESFDLPHHRGAEHVMHLLSVVSPLASDLALVFEPLAPVPLLQALDARGIRRVHCAPEEFDSQGCNVLAVAPGVVVMTEGNPRTRRALERAGCDVHVYDATELNKGDGGPTCLTRPILRA